MPPGKIGLTNLALVYRLSLLLLGQAAIGVATTSEARKWEAAYVPPIQDMSTTIYDAHTHGDGERHIYLLKLPFSEVST